MNEEEAPNYRSGLQNKIDEQNSDSINISNFREEQYQMRTELRKNRIFNILLSKRKIAFKNNEVIKTNDPRQIDINTLNCDEEIKTNLENYIKTKFDIKNWFKYLFSKNKNDIQVALFLIRTFIELQLTQIEESKRTLSRNNTELIQRLCEYLLYDDVKIVYYSCACLTNLTIFPKNIENRIYSERNLEKIIKFFNIITKNISLYGSESLTLFVNITTNEDVVIYLIKNSFLEYIYSFLNDIINNKINFINNELEQRVIYSCIIIISNLIKAVYIDDNYINKFLFFIPICKLITSKYYVNIDNSLFDERMCNYLIQIWESYAKKRNDAEKIVIEITKDGFFKILVLLYYKLKGIELKINMNKVFCDLLSLNDNQNEILINNGIITFLAQEIERYQFSKVDILKYIIFSCINIAKGTIGHNELLCNSGIIYKIIDITNFYINDNLDKEIRDLLINCIICLCNAINGSAGKTRENIILYKNMTIINIFCKALKLDLDPFNKKKLIEYIIYSFNEMNVTSEELDPELEKAYDIMLVNNSLVDLLGSYSDKKNLDDVSRNFIEDIIDFIKSKEEEKKI